MNRSQFLKHTAAAVVFALGAAGSALAQEKGTAAEAKSLLDAATAHVKAVGAPKAYQDFTNDKSKWVKKDLYVFVFDMKGNTLAHGGNAKLVGQNLNEMRDDKGRSGTEEMAKIVKASGSGSYDYDFVHPATQKTMPKTSYVTRVPGADAYLGVGIYR